MRGSVVWPGRAEPIRPDQVSPTSIGLIALFRSINNKRPSSSALHYVGKQPRRRLNQRIHYLGPALPCCEFWRAFKYAAGRLLASNSPLRGPAARGFRYGRPTTAAGASVGCRLVHERFD